MACHQTDAKRFFFFFPLSAGLKSFETFLCNTSVLYSLLVAYALVQALVLTLMLCSFVQRW